MSAESYSSPDDSLHKFARRIMSLIEGIDFGGLACSPGGYLIPEQAFTGYTPVEPARPAPILNEDHGRWMAYAWSPKQ